jgi:hypothetical protein
MKALGDDAIKGVLSTTDLIRETATTGTQAAVSESYGLPDNNFVSAKTLADITEPLARAALTELNCTYGFGYGAEEYTDENGWTCMLSVDQATTLTMLQTISEKLITTQLMTLSLDYVIYNGWAETFAYVVVNFGFQPSGLVYKSVESETVNLQLHSGGHGAILLLLEIIVMCFNVYYLFMLFWAMAKSMFPRKDKHTVTIGDRVTVIADNDPSVIGIVQGFGEDRVIVQFPKAKKEYKNHDLKKVQENQERQKSVASCTHKFFEVLREFIFFFALDWFNIIDFLSCVCTIVTLSLFWQFTLSPLGSSFFFQEEPTWVKGKCVSNNFEWCSDKEVITQFYVAKGTFKNFVRIVSVNTVFIFIRLLRYVKAFKSMQVIFNTMVRGFEDICWFVVVMFTGLLGYQFCGHIVFGGTAAGFRTKWSSLRACFEIFLGKFDGMAMAAVSLPVMILYVLTFWFFFKLIVINMFLAIIDKNYKEEDKDRLAGAALPKSKKPPSAASQIVRALKGLFTAKDQQDQQAAPGDTKGSDDQAAIVAVPDAPDTGGTSGMQNGMNDHGDMGGTGVDPTLDKQESKPLVHDEGKGDTNGDLDGRLPTVTMDAIKKSDFKDLPEEIKEWSIEKANAVCEILNDLIESRRQVEKESEDEPDPAKLDLVLEDAETKILNSVRDWGEEATKVKENLDRDELAELKNVHKDQESLSWYIMKREAELKKLESAKELKQERFDKMAQAAKSLINSKDDVASA